MDQWRINIKEIRESLDLNQEQAAELSGLSNSLISQMENGKKPFTQTSLEALAKALRCTIYDFFVITSNAQEKPSGEGEDITETLHPDIAALVEWIDTQDDPDRIASNIRFMVETRYPEFEKWPKETRDKKRVNKVMQVLRKIRELKDVKIGEIEANLLIDELIKNHFGLDMVNRWKNLRRYAHILQPVGVKMAGDFLMGGIIDTGKIITGEEEYSDNEDIDKEERF